MRTQSDSKCKEIRVHIKNQNSKNGRQDNTPATSKYGVIKF